MKLKSTKNKKSVSGQVMTEYIIMLVLLTLVALACLGLFSVFSEYGINVRKQVSIDMP